MDIDDVTPNKNNDLRRKQLKEIVKEKGMLWAIAAMVEGSIGYHSPKSAEIRIKALMEDRYVMGCERCSAVFGGDSIAELEYDFKYFKAVEERNPERVKKIMQIVEKVAKWSPEAQMAFGLLYPTHV